VREALPWKMGNNEDSNNINTSYLKPTQLLPFSQYVNRDAAENINKDRDLGG
jgi:hypothetical protein